LHEGDTSSAVLGNRCRCLSLLKHSLRHFQVAVQKNLDNSLDLR
jgi:hypothetical protein